MKIILCLDDNNGMLFNNRRQSRDRVLVEDIINNLQGEKLNIFEFSKALFEDFSDKICIAEKLEKLRDLEVLSNDHSSVISGLISMEYTMATFISDFESDITVNRFVYGFENTRNGFYFHYLVLEKMIAENFPMFLIRFRRMAMIADEGFEKIWQNPLLYLHQNLPEGENCLKI